MTPFFNFHIILTKPFRSFFQPLLRFYEHSYKFSGRGLLFLIVCLYGSSLLACSTFEIYPGFNRSRPRDRFAKRDTNRPKTVGQLIKEIAKVPNHEKFLELYSQSQLSRLPLQEQTKKLSCFLGYLKDDSDGDGTNDWRIVINEQIQEKVVPWDSDWDNDGIENILDPFPFKKQDQLSKSRQTLPKHLWLSKSKDDSIDVLQNQLLSDCGVVAAHHTDSHQYSILQTFYELCKSSTQKSLKNHLIVYAFASHAVSDVKAAFYPGLNMMSVPGQLSKPSDHDMKLTLAHELGHYYVFNFLKPQQLASLACQYTSLKLTSPIQSFFDSRLLQPFLPEQSGFFPTQYSYSNVHEWFSEMYAHYLVKKLDPAYAMVEIPPAFNEWMSRL